MKSSFRFGLFFLGVLALLPRSGQAQHTLYMQQGTAMYPVISVIKEHAYLKVDGALEPVSLGGRTMMRPNAAYPPVIIQVVNLDGKFRNGSNGSLNHMLKSFSMRAGFVTSAPIDGVFMFLAVTMKSGLAQTFFHEIGNLEPGKAKYITFDHDLAETFDYDSFTVYLFANGAELLHTAMPERILTSAMHKMVRQQLADVQTAGPKPLIAPLPTYPVSLRDKKIQGQAVLSFTVSSEGRATDAKVVSSDDPAFGAAALAAVADWWFVPGVKERKPIPSVVRLPIKFAP